MSEAAYLIVIRSMRLLGVSMVLIASVLTSCMTYEGATVSGRWRDVTREDIVTAEAVARAQADKLKEPRVNLEIVAVINSDEIELLWDQSGPHRAHDYLKRIHGTWQWIMETIDVG